MKKALIVTYQFPPCASSGVYRTLRFINAMPQFGWEPIVLTVNPKYYPPDIPLDWDLIEKLPTGLKTFQTRTLPNLDRLLSSRHNFKKKLGTSKKKELLLKKRNDNPVLNCSGSRNYWQGVKDAFTISLMIPDKQNVWLPYAVWEGLKISRKEVPHLVYASGGPWTSLLVAAILKKLTKLPLVIDFRDPWVDNPYNEQDFILRRKINRFFESWCTKTADRVIANTDPLKKLLLEKYSSYDSSEKIITITNGFDDSEFEGIKALPSKVPKRLITFSHVGTLYSKRSPKSFLIALAKLITKGQIKPTEVKVLFVGKNDLPELKSLLARYQLTDIVELVEPVPKKEALKILMNSDILLLIQPQTRLQIPAKLFEYIRARKPIIAICGDGATKELIESYNMGRVAEESDIDAISEIILEMWQNVCGVGSSHRSSDYFIDSSTLNKFNSIELTKHLVSIFNQITNGTN